MHLCVDPGGGTGGNVFILASPFSGCLDLWASLLGGSELWVYCFLASWVFGCPDSWVYCNPGSSDSSAHLDLRLSVWMFAVGRMVLLFFLGSHGTLVGVSEPFMMPLLDSDIPMNVPFTFSNKQPLTPAVLPEGMGSPSHCFPA
jgi:hypothetical protein